MNRLAKQTVGVILLAATIGVAQAGAASDVEAITAVLNTYEQVLNASDLDGVMRLYAEDGVFMPQHSPSAVGRDAVRQAYENVFDMIKLEIEFDIIEVERIAPGWAFARTNSAGTVTILADGARLTEANQELFIFRKQSDGLWKIARYIFSTTNPPRQ
jgi:uncharacterized protein (TIGR02246 family)